MPEYYHHNCSRFIFYVSAGQNSPKFSKMLPAVFKPSFFREVILDTFILFFLIFLYIVYTYNQRKNPQQYEQDYDRRRDREVDPGDSVDEDRAWDLMAAEIIFFDDFEEDEW